MEALEKYYQLPISSSLNLMVLYWIFEVDGRMLIKFDDLLESDPFADPLEHGCYIDDLTDTHRMLFNKFAVCDMHMLVTTNEFKR